MADHVGRNADDGIFFNFPVATINNNNPPRYKPKALIITDSRGFGISSQIVRNQQINSLKGADIDVKILSGATLQEIQEQTRRACTFKTYDLIIVIGGICNLTEIASWNRLNVLHYPVKDLQSIRATLTELREQFQEKIIFSTICSAGLTKYARAKNYIDQLPKDLEQLLTENQARLNKDIESINDWILANNKEFDCTNIDLNKLSTSQSIKRKFNGEKYRVKHFSDKNLYDGVHGNMAQREKWHKRTIDVIYQELRKRFYSQ